jgi:hypothetical protein
MSICELKSSHSCWCLQWEVGLEQSQLEEMAPQFNICHIFKNQWHFCTVLGWFFNIFRPTVEDGKRGQKSVIIIWSWGGGGSCSKDYPTAVLMDPRISACSSVQRYIVTGSAHLELNSNYVYALRKWISFFQHIHKITPLSIQKQLDTCCPTVWRHTVIFWYYGLGTDCLGYVSLGSHFLRV